MPAPDFCEALLREAQVMVFPGELFGDDSGHYIRFSYLQPLERIHEALARMSVFVEKLRI